MFFVTTRPAPRMTLVGDVETLEDTTSGRTYPLKIYRVMRNDSNRAADVRISDYTPDKITLKKFETEVLQLRFRIRDWAPTPDGVDHVAVLPGQQLRFWLGAMKTNLQKI